MIVWSNFFAKKRSEMIIIINPTPTTGDQPEQHNQQLGSKK
jgi:hypothetical protein